MSPAFSPTRYVISTRRKAKRELLLLPAITTPLVSSINRNSVRPFKGIFCRGISEFESFSRWVGDRRSDAGCHSQVVVLVPGADAVSSAEGDTAA
jgi:hypothetical protein